MEARFSGSGRVALLLAVAGIVLAGGCHTITEDAPTDPSPVSGVVQPISIPVILSGKPAPTPTPTPDPGGTPSPTPTPTPEPTPEPDPGPTTGACNLPPSNPKDMKCTDGPPQLDAEVDAAIDRVTKKRPELFDFDNKKCGNCYYVKNVDAYAAQVVKELGKVGLCALWDGEEVAVKETNARSEQYDIILASNHIRRIPGAYRGVCKPSWF
jgi:hypothetical protein